MVNQFDFWNTQKQLLNSREKPGAYFSQREIWWCRIGKNVGYEQDGKGELFERPVLILKKLGGYTFIGIPITTKLKLGRIFIPFELSSGGKRVATIGQIKTFDARRLKERLDILPAETFESIRKAAKDLL
jgi:mRNA interferase MazF